MQGYGMCILVNLCPHTDALRIGLAQIERKSPAHLFLDIGKVFLGLVKAFEINQWPQVTFRIRKERPMLLPL